MTQPRVLETQVCIIGGGATGAGIARDLALRGVDCILIEKSDFAAGATGRCHGLLHSGARYAVRDPEAAAECIQENALLKRMAPQCIEDTGGLFVAVTDDDMDYLPSLMEACESVGIQAVRLTPAQAAAREPGLSDRTKAAVLVPDAAVDPFKLTLLNVRDARTRGARIFNYCEVVGFEIESGRIVAVHCKSTLREIPGAGGTEIIIRTEWVVNAAGSWAGKVAGLAGVRVGVVQAKGTLVVYNHRLVNMVVNRCRLPGDGDIIVPGETVCLAGTTSVEVPGPDREDYTIEDEEIQLILREASAMVPAAGTARVLRAFAGVRPLYEPESGGLGSREVTRNYELIDHGINDSVSNFLTIVGGKLTTYRQMAQTVCDYVCRRMGNEARCLTAEIPLGEAGEAGKDAERSGTGPGAGRSEKRGAISGVVCECENVTKAQIRGQFASGEARSLSDLRRRTRLGMGTCQGTYCAYRAMDSAVETGAVHPEDVNTELVRFFDERWSGIRHVLFGDQLREAELTRYIYGCCFNLQHDHGNEVGGC